MKKTKQNAGSPKEPIPPFVLDAAASEGAEAQSEETSVDLFVMLALIGKTKGECDAAALNHIEALKAQRMHDARDAGLELRARLLALGAAAHAAVLLHDEGTLAVYADQVSDHPAVPGQATTQT